MTDASKAEVWDGYVEPYGQTQVIDTTPGGMSLRLPGQQDQFEAADLFQNGNRDYDPNLGRYIEADPLGIDAGQSVYAYVDGDPLDGIDPRGLWPFGAPKSGFRFGNTRVPSEREVVRQLEAALIQSGVCNGNAQAHQIAIDIVDLVGWGDLPLAQAIMNSLQNQRPLTPAQQRQAQDFIGRLPAAHRKPLTQLLLKGGA